MVDQRLLKFLGPKQAELVCAAINLGLLIVIDGDRTKATGKSTLCDYLRGKGAAAYEAWELEEGNIRPDSDANCNSVCITIRLNEELPI